MARLQPDRSPSHASALEQLGALLNERLSTGPSVVEEHGRDESWYPYQPPDAVALPTSTEEVQAIVRICAEQHLPIVPYGAGTSLEGHVLAVEGGLSLDMSRMDRVVAIRPGDLDATVEAGVTRRQLAKRLEDHGLFFPVDPGADASFGGMTATGASGTTTVRYGTMRDNVLVLRVVLADGRVIDTGRRARKSSAGYDLTRLFVGSEGTLGVITEVTVKVWGLPEAMSAAVVSFPSLENAVEAATELIQAGVPVARVELLDEVGIDAVNRHSGLDHPLRPTLFLELHGSPATVTEEAEEAGRVAAEHGGEDFRWSTDGAERARLWHARHQAYFATLALRTGCRAMSTDVCVPLSRLSDCLLQTKQDLERGTLVAPIVGHVGDGNFHCIVLIDPNDPAEVEEAKRFNQRLVERAQAMDGTCTGEHGVGIGKRRFLPAEHGEALDVMRSLKQALDPAGLMNPGKIFLDDSSA
nr:probable D-lactate dehydrogenase, mitochondrial [Nerophis lumbriciformis]